MALVYECEVPDLNALFVRDPSPAIVIWQGRKALRLSGHGGCLLVVPGIDLPHGRVEVQIGADAAAYPGIVFHLLDSFNYELAYAQTQSRGKWDTLQYDPIFHGSNTWQLFHGHGSQKTAQVPLHKWFNLSLIFNEQHALLQLGQQDPLWIDRLVHPQQSGMVGLWTYLTAHFTNLRVWDVLPEFPARKGEPYPLPPPTGTIGEWCLDGFGRVTTEHTGILNLNRYLPVSTNEARLLRDFELPEDSALTFTVGFSDELTLQVDDQVVFNGENTWKDSPNWSDRGYVTLDQQVTLPLPKGRHRLVAILKSKEYFGFGLILRIDGDRYRLLPAQFSA